MILNLLLAVLCQAQPNVLLITLDDAGWPEWSSMPNVQALASQGVTFERAYTTSPVCSPSRLAMLTGRYARREGIGDLSLDSLAINVTQDRLPLSLVFLPEVLSANSYVCGLIGKDHLGRAPLNNGSDLGLSPWALARVQAPIAPFTRGFSYWRGGNPSYQTSYYNWWRADDGLLSQEAMFATNVQMDEFVQLWAEISTPRFVALSWTAPHYPYDPPPGDGPTGSLRGDYLQLVRDVDDAIGIILQIVDLSTTYVVVTADNGTPDNARPPRSPSLHWKGSTYDGGCRVPLLVAGPGVAPRVEHDRVVSLVDLPATLAELVGVKLTEGAFDDSVSFADALGNWQGSSPRDFAFCERYEVVNPFTQPIGYDDQAVIEKDTFWPGTSTKVRLKLRRVDADGNGPNPSQDWVYDLLSDPQEKSPTLLSDPIIRPSVRSRLLTELASLPPRP